MKIFLSSRADKQLQKLPLKMHEVILNRIEKLNENPFPPNVKKLKARDGWRIRLGDYRILYAVDLTKKEIIILSVAHRKEAYQF